MHPKSTTGLQYEIIVCEIDFCEVVYSVKQLHFLLFSCYLSSVEQKKPLLSEVKESSVLPHYGM